MWCGTSYPWMPGGVCVCSQGRVASDITKEELAQYFNLPSEEAAARLGVGLTVLKKLCRKYGVPRWPYRLRKSVEKLINNLEVWLGSAWAGLQAGRQAALLEFCHDESGAAHLPVACSCPCVMVWLYIHHCDASMHRCRMGGISCWVHAKC